MNGRKWQVSSEGGVQPVWNPNGRELFYRQGDTLMAVDIATDGEPAAERLNPNERPSPMETVAQ